jgi:hypothetical protein
LHFLIKIEQNLKNYKIRSKLCVINLMTRNEHLNAHLK